eukprot:Gb_02916 [translate_table: standard]
MRILEIQVACGTLGLSTVTVKLIGPEGEEHIACAVGTGPVHAAYNAVDSIVKVFYRLLIWSQYCLRFSVDLLPFCSAFSYIFENIFVDYLMPITSLKVALQIPVTLLDYSLSSVTKGIDAIASTKVLLRGQQGHSSTYALNGETTKRTFSGTGAGTDIVVSSVQAYINALNKLLGFRVGSMGKTSGKVPNVSA